MILLFTLSQYIREIRRLTRLPDGVPFTDTDYAHFINHAKDALHGSVPFNLKTVKLNSEKGRSFYQSDAILGLTHILDVSVYPFEGGRMKGFVATADSKRIIVSGGDMFFRTPPYYVIVGDYPQVEIFHITSVSTQTQNNVTDTVLQWTNDNEHRGRFGTEKIAWSPTAQGADIPVRYWEPNAKWVPLKPASETSVYREADWFKTPSDLVSGKTFPDTYAIKSNSVIFNRAFYCTGYQNIWIQALVNPPDLVNAGDKIEGLVAPFHRLVVLFATIDVLSALGGEEAVRRASMYYQEMTLLLRQFEVYVEHRVRGHVAGVSVALNRPPTMLSPTPVMFQQQQ